MNLMKFDACGSATFESPVPMDNGMSEVRRMFLLTLSSSMKIYWPGFSTPSAASSPVPGGLRICETGTAAQVPRSATQDLPGTDCVATAQLRIIMRPMWIKAMPKSAEPPPGPGPGPRRSPCSSGPLSRSMTDLPAGCPVADIPKSLEMKISFSKNIGRKHTTCLNKTFSHGPNLEDVAGHWKGSKDDIQAHNSTISPSAHNQNFQSQLCVLECVLRNITWDLPIFGSGVAPITNQGSSRSRILASLKNYPCLQSKLYPNMPS